jgi:hypothetical protein
MTSVPSSWLQAKAGNSEKKRARICIVGAMGGMLLEAGWGKDFEKI